MPFFSFVFAAVLATVANAHFQLQYPLPRGPFIRNLEPTFCDGYTDAVENRTVFPISNGVIDMKSEHPLWDVGVIVSTIQDPNTFADFKNSSGFQMVVKYFQTSGEGKYCFPINISASGVTGIQDGANVTIQVIFDGGDGTLFQCADLTLSSDVTVPRSAVSSCTNITKSRVSKTSGAERNMTRRVSGVIATTLTGAMLLLLGGAELRLTNI